MQIEVDDDAQHELDLNYLECPDAHKGAPYSAVDTRNLLYLLSAAIVVAIRHDGAREIDRIMIYADAKNYR